MTDTGIGSFYTKAAECKQEDYPRHCDIKLHLMNYNDIHIVVKQQCLRESNLSMLLYNNGYGYNRNDRRLSSHNLALITMSRTI